MLMQYYVFWLRTVLCTAEALTAAQQRSSEQLSALQHALEEAQQAAAAARAEADAAKVSIWLQSYYTADWLCCFVLGRAIADSVLMIMCFSTACSICSASSSVCVRV
jgi:hypothetical protein